MNVSSITEHINGTHADIHPLSAGGATSSFYNPDRKLARGIYFATIKEKDGKNDRASNLDRTDVFASTSASRKDFSLAETDGFGHLPSLTLGSSTRPGLQARPFESRSRPAQAGRSRPAKEMRPHQLAVVRKGGRF
jgi:hypothetical protein